MYTVILLTHSVKVIIISIKQMYKIAVKKLANTKGF